jgi:hypothetical protein
MELAQLKHINLNEVKQFLSENHTNFSVLTAILKVINQRSQVIISKNSAKNFYLGRKHQKNPTPPATNSPSLPEDCLKDAQNCAYFQYFNRKQNRLYRRFLDKVEVNFEGEDIGPLIFLTLTFNTTHNNIFAFTTN